MEALRNLLSWSTSARDPIVMTILLAITAALVLLLIHHPHLYLSLIVITAPLPKLFTLTQYESYGNRQSAAGFSVADIVLGAGLIALLFRGGRYRRSREAAGFGRAMLFWSATVLLSVLVGLLLWPGIYLPGNALYAFRYILTLLSYAVALPYAMNYCNERSMRSLLRQLLISGNVVIALGILYFFKIEGASNTSGDILWNADSTVFRSFLFFFDYGIDMGYFVVTIAILNLMLLSSGAAWWMRFIGGIGLVLCVIAVLLLGERVNVLVLGCALTYFLFETGLSGHRSVRTGAVFQITCLLAVLLVGGVVLQTVAPQQMIQKFDNVTDNQFASDAADDMSQANVPPSVISVVSTLPIGDFAIRLSLSVASLWFFFQHPLGVGFWGELPVTGWYAHHEIVKIAVEQSIPGLAACFWLIFKLRRLLWAKREMYGSAGQLGVLLRSISVGFFVAMIGANIVLLDMKFAMVYWTLVGVWSVLPRTATVRYAPLVMKTREVVSV